MQAIDEERSDDWIDFSTSSSILVLPGGQYFGIMPKGTLLESPCHKFYMQLLEPPPGSEDIEWEERLLRVGLGAPDIRAAVKALRERGVVFVDRDPIQPSDKGALTQIYLGGVTFEFVRSHLSLRAAPKVRVRNELDHSGWTPSRSPVRSKRNCAPFATPASRRSCFRRATSRAPRGRGRGRRGREEERAARHRIPGAAGFRGAVGPPARVQDRHRPRDLTMCHALGSKVLLVCSTTSTHATEDSDAYVRDLRKLAMLAVRSE